MKRLSCALAVLCGLCLTITTSVAKPSLTGHTRVSEEQDTDEVTIEQVIQVIQEALLNAQTNNVPGFPPLKSATIALNTVTTKQTSAGVNFIVFSIGTKYETETASTLQLVMAPPQTIDKTGPQSLDPMALKNALAQAINLAKAAVVQVKDGKVKLVMNTVKLELKFTVKVEGSAGAKIVLIPIGLEGSGKLARSKIHTIAMEFGAR